MDATFGPFAKRLEAAVKTALEEEVEQIAAPLIEEFVEKLETQLRERTALIAIACLRNYDAEQLQDQLVIKVRMPEEE